MGWIVIIGLGIAIACSPYIGKAAIELGQRIKNEMGEKTNEFKQH